MLWDLVGSAATQIFECIFLREKYQKRRGLLSACGTCLAATETECRLALTCIFSRCFRIEKGAGDLG